AAQPTPAAEPVPAGAPEEDGVPARAEEAAPATAEAPVAAEPQPAGTTGFEDAPEEQPFEREGRWWFKRADELLVYDEQTGQWEPAPAEATAPSGRPAPPPQAETGWSEPAPQAAQPADTAQGGFWKCPSCGAVNGSTATACRMCFTPKP
ncbi:MAG: zinc finger protein, partial [Actinomycetota bacterium]